MEFVVAVGDSMTLVEKHCKGLKPMSWKELEAWSRIDSSLEWRSLEQEER